MAWGSSINWANVTESNVWQNSAYSYANDAYNRKSANLTRSGLHRPTEVSAAIPNIQKEIGVYR